MLSNSTWRGEGGEGPPPLLGSSLITRALRRRLARRRVGGGRGVDLFCFMVLLWIKFSNAPKKSERWHFAEQYLWREGVGVGGKSLVTVSEAKHHEQAVVLDRSTGGTRGREEFGEAVILVEGGMGARAIVSRGEEEGEVMALELGEGLGVQRDL